jgi:hypothetical protein
MRKRETIESATLEGLDRREFTLRSILLMLSGVTITISGCGDGDENPVQPTVTDKVGTISNNHGHTAVIEAAKLSAGGAVTLDIQGSASHNHKVELTAGEVVSIRNGQQVAKTSSTDNSHSHTVTFN